MTTIDDKLADLDAQLDEAYAQLTDLAGELDTAQRENRLLSMALDNAYARTRYLQQQLATDAGHPSSLKARAADLYNRHNQRKARP